MHALVSVERTMMPVHFATDIAGMLADRMSLRVMLDFLETLVRASLTTRAVVKRKPC